LQNFTLKESFAANELKSPETHKLYKQTHTSLPSTDYNSLQLRKCVRPHMYVEPCRTGLAPSTSYVTCTDDCLRSLVVSLIHSRLDYGNFILVGLPAYLQRHLQSVLNGAARLVFRLRRYDPITDAVTTLHCFFCIYLNGLTSKSL